MNEAVRAAHKNIQRWREDPVSFVREVLGAEPDPWQAKILNEFPRNRRLAMKASKGVGKTTILSWLCWNFMATRLHPKVAATSITADNLSDGLWAEMAKWQSSPSAKHGTFLKEAFQWTKTRIFAKDHPETWFMSARTWAKGADSQKQADTLAGLHADNIMFVLDESGGIPDAVMAAAEAALANDMSDITDAKIVQAGNPTHLSGPLYRACSTEKKIWHVVEISSDPEDPMRAPRVSIKWAQEQIDKYGKDNPWVLVNVFGQFPPSSLNSLLGVDEVNAAMGRPLHASQFEFSQKRLGVDVARFGDDKCFDDRTEILTNDGWKLFSNLIGTEKVLSVGANSEKACWGNILHIHKAAFDGELNIHEKKNCNFAITDNHRLLVRKNPKSDEYRFKTFKELPKNFVLREVNGWSGESSEFKKFEMVKNMPNGGHCKKKYCFDFNDWAEFLGWFISEGNVYKPKRRENEFRIIITQYPGEKREAIEALLTRMGVGWRSCSNGTQVEFASKVIGEYLIKECGVGASNKKIPFEMKNASEKSLKVFLDAFLKGDGTCRKDGKGRCYISSSKKLMDDIQEILAKLGISGGLYSKNKKGSKFYIGEREVVRRNDTYVLYERSTAKGKNIDKKNIKRVPYKGFVWCVATELESIYVRRNGIPMWSGNTIIFPRQGLAAFKPIEMRGARSNEIAARVIMAKEKWGSDLEFIDGTGGYGSGVVDSMLQGGYPSHEIHFSGKAIDNRYFNKRAEMWFLMAEWIKRGGALPNVPELVAELTVPTYSFKNGKFIVEPKDQIKERLGSSPDYADALCLSFALPEAAARNTLEHHRQKSGMASEYDPFSDDRM